MKRFTDWLLSRDEFQMLGLLAAIIFSPLILALIVMNLLYWLS